MHLEHRRGCLEVCGTLLVEQSLIRLAHSVQDNRRACSYEICTYGVTEACRGMHMEHTNKILQHNAWNIQYEYMCVSIYICMDVVYICIYIYVRC